MTYGLRAFEAGTITAEQLVTLNEQVGSDDINWSRGPHGCEATGVRRPTRAAGSSTRKRLAEVPILDLRGSSNQEIHTDYHSWALRARLDAANGTHANQVIWTSHPLTIDPLVQARSFFDMDTWLAAIDRRSPLDPTGRQGRARQAGSRRWLLRCWPAVHRPDDVRHGCSPTTATRGSRRAASSPAECSPAR